MLLVFLACLHYTEVGEVGVMRNVVNGRLELDTPGWHFSPPWVLVSHADTRPMRVCVTSAGRGYNCKLVQFVPEFYEEFVATEGFRYWWWANRLSFNWGYEEEYRGFRDLMRGYAYSAKQYPFVQVLTVYEE